MMSSRDRIIPPHMYRLWRERLSIPLRPGDAVVIERLRSPFVYRDRHDFRTELLAFADSAADRAAIGRHYLHVGAGRWNRYGGSGDVPLKRTFYALRGAGGGH